MAIPTGHKYTTIEELKERKDSMKSRFVINLTSLDKLV